jgi:hypothetical protein
MNENLSKMSEGEGNAKTPPKSRKQTPYWKCNYHIKEEEEFVEVAEQIEALYKMYMPLDKYIFGEEYGGSGKTPHLECYLKFKTKKEWHKIMEVFKWSDLQPSKKCNFQAGIDYCSKECNRIWTNIKLPKPLVKVKYEMLRKDQKLIVDLFKEDEDPIHGRKIWWFWESDGNWGKSFTCLHLIDYCGALIVQGKNNDILHGVKDYYDNQGEIPRIIVFDIPRVNSGHVSYQAIESLKNGFFYSGKYEGGMVRFNKPHIICFSNQSPEIDKLSEDRWKILALKNEFSLNVKVISENGGEKVNFKEMKN